jgi:hypothetical protein
VSINGQPLPAGAFDHQDGVLRLRFANTAETLHIAIAR